MRRTAASIIPTIVGFRKRHRAALGHALLGAFSLLPARVMAEEPHKSSEPRVLREPSEIVQVVDAFDDDDRFDLHLSLGFESSWRSAKIFRESSITAAGYSDGGYTRSNLNVARYSQHISRLNPRAEIGVYRDIALIVRLPIVISDNRELTGLDGSERNQSLALEGAPGEQLFGLPFKSPTRSGIEYLALGIDANVFNQARDSSKPTWLVGIEGRFDIGEPMHACNERAATLNRNSGLRPGQAQERCAELSDVNRNGVGGEYPTDTPAGSLEGNFSGGRGPGVSRGVTALEAHTIISRRVKYIEPYGGFRGLIEFPNSSSDYQTIDVRGSLVNHPPLRGTMIFGTNVIPWEVREAFQRLTLDFRFTGTYVSEGRDYSELFDALGSSDATSLRYPNYSEFQQNGSPNASDPSDPASVVNPTSRKVYFTGLTDVQQHGVYALSASTTWQAGQYVKFNLGGTYAFTQAHFITLEKACNPDFTDSLEKAGPCRVSKRNADGETVAAPGGIPNPNYRRTVSAPGRRFKVGDANDFSLFVNATVMF